MRPILLLAGALALASAGAAAAKPDHSAHGPNRHGPAAKGYGVGGCPPGLAKKNELCMPPGQYKKLFAVGQRVPAGYGFTPYAQLPYDLRRQYRLSDRDRYIYRDGYLYRVDPKTMLVAQILDGIL